MKHSHTIKDLRSFLLLWGSQTISELGTAMTDYAIIVWVYSQKGTASSVTLLTLCTFMPTILFRFIAGTFADRWNKKRIMLIVDLVAACGTAAVISPISYIDDLDTGKRYSFGEKPGPMSKKLFDTLRGIQYGEIEDKHGWTTVVIE